MTHTPTATETYRYSRLLVKSFNVEVPIVVVGRVVYFPVRTFCEAIGITGPQRQIQRIRDDARFTDGALRELPVPTVKGLRLTMCLRQRQVATWLTLIEPNKLSITARGPLELFQRELFAAAERFLFGDTSDVVTSVERAKKPVVGVLHLGDCPRCGLALCLTTDESGAHLIPDVDVERTD